MFKVKVHLETMYGVDEQYKRFIELLMSISNLEEWEIVDRKDDWVEYEVFEDKEYIIECELSAKEKEVVSKQFYVTVL